MDKKPKKPIQKTPNTPIQKPSQSAEDIDMLVCARTGGADVLPGSVWDKCRDCGFSVWISLSGQGAMKSNKKLVPFCIQCAYKNNKNNKDLEVQIAPGSLQELKRYLANTKKH